LSSSASGDLGLSFYCLQQVLQLSDFWANRDESLPGCAGRILKVPGCTFERAYIISLDLRSATIAGDETFFASPFACRHAGRAVAFVSFMSVEKLQCAGNHEYHL
jgi:hypothetical protein